VNGVGVLSEMSRAPGLWPLASIHKTHTVTRAQAAVHLARDP